MKLLGDVEIAFVRYKESVGQHESSGTAVELPMIAPGTVRLAKQILTLEVVVKQISGKGFDEYTAPTPDHVQIWLLDQDDLSEHHALLMQWTRWHRSAHQKEPVMYVIQSVNTELFSQELGVSWIRYLQLICRSSKACGKQFLAVNCGTLSARASRSALSGLCIGCGICDEETQEGSQHIQTVVSKRGASCLDPVGESRRSPKKQRYIEYVTTYCFAPCTARNFRTRNLLLRLVRLMPA